VQLSHGELAERLNRTPGSVKGRINRLQLKLTTEQKLLKKQAAMNKGRAKCNRDFTESEIEFLKQNHAHKSNAELSKLMGRSESSIAGKAFELCLKKSAQYIKVVRKKGTDKAFKNYLRPSQRLTDKYILRAIMCVKCTDDDINLYQNAIETHRQRIMQNRKLREKDG
jgi:hypothetical protein